VVIEISSDESDSSPAPNRRKEVGRRRKPRGTEEAELDADIDDLLDGGVVHDSIMDDSAEEEDEVGGLLDDDDDGEEAEE